MKKAEWRKGRHPKKLLEALEGRASLRKLRLYAVACCLRIWHLLPEEASRAAVETAARYADGLASAAELAAAERAARGLADRARKSWAWPPCYAAHPKIEEWAAYIGEGPAQAVHDDLKARARSAAAATAAQHKEEARQADLVRDIFGDPFREAAFSPSWRTPDVLALARAVYDDRHFEDLPVLADALEDAGCASAAILAHCRAGGGHARGCWALDLILDRT